MVFSITHNFTIFWCLYLNTLERFYIHKEATQDNHLNDDHAVVPNKIFRAIQKITTPPTNHLE
jgi:hypothetical protein